MNQPPNLLGGGGQVYTLDESEEHSRAIFPSCPNNSCQYLDSFFLPFIIIIIIITKTFSNKWNLISRRTLEPAKGSVLWGGQGRWLLQSTLWCVSFHVLLSERQGLRQSLPRWTNERGELTGSCRWPDWVWEITNRSKLKTSEKLPIVLEEFQEYATSY